VPLDGTDAHRLRSPGTSRVCAWIAFFHHRILGLRHWRGVEGVMNQQPQASPAEIFDRYFGPALFAPWARVLLEHAAPEPADRVLDVACGTGTVAHQAAPLVGAGGKVVGVDVNPGMLAVARSKPVPDGARIEWLEQDAMALDLPDGAFDLVVCQQGLQFFPDRAAAASEMRRVVRDGGRVLLSVWQGLDVHPLYSALCISQARHLGVPLADVAAPWSLPDADEIRALLVGAGLRGVDVAARTLTVRFPSPEQFVYLTLSAGAAFLPEFDWNDEVLRTKLIDNVTRDIESVVREYTGGDVLEFPTSWHIAAASK
jgi:SAM-dependent methyltransferase